ncbi:MAG: tyrosine-type recombinase/integrase [Hyphomicrobiaceae bacterium]
MRRLTETQIAEIKSPRRGQRLEVSDSTVPGLVLRVTPAGVKSYCVRYRHQGRSLRYTLGKTPPMSLKEARKGATDILARVRAGENPMVDKRKAAKRVKTATVETVISRFIEKGMSENRESHTINLKRTFAREVTPRWGTKDIADIAADDVANLLDKIESNNVKRQTYYGLRKLFAYAHGLRFISASPIGENFPAPSTKINARDRVLTRDEVKAVWQATEEPTRYNRIVRLLLLTGQRENEVAKSHWHEFDFKKRLWTIPAERAKNGIAHTLPLSDAALKILKTIDQREGVTLVFPAKGNDKTAFSGWSKAKINLDSSSGVTDWRLHDLRRTMATRLADAGFPPHVIERLQNHKQGEIKGVAAIYNRAKYLKEMRAAVDAWAEHIDKLSRPAPVETIEPPPKRRRVGEIVVGSAPREGFNADQIIAALQPTPRDPFDDVED